MLKLKTLSAGVIAASFAAFALPSQARDVYVTIDPPAPRIERMEPRSGYVIVPGNWQWRNGRHHWTSGRYVAERRGYNWQGDRWVQHDNRRWTMQRGGWSRDSDGDGTPDRIDNAPNNPRRQ
jgi:hypothetical protein